MLISNCFIWDLINKTQFDIEETGTPIPFKWGKCKLATSAYGHGITTTPLQASTVYAALSNGGEMVKPSLIKSKRKIWRPLP